MPITDSLDELRRTLVTVRSTPDAKNAYIMACALAQRAIEALAIAASIAVQEADRNDAQELARLMYGSPALRLAYCQDHALLPPIDVRTGKYPAFACVDEYWRTAIAGEVIVGRHLALAAAQARGYVRMSGEIQTTLDVPRKPQPKGAKG